MSTDGIYPATVANNVDPLSQYRVTLYIPQILGTAESAWALPIQPTETVPPLGTTLWVHFSGGDVTKPVYTPLDVVVPFLDAGKITAGTLNAVDITGSTITGTTFSGTSFVINTDGAFFYLGTPGTGNLVTSIASTAGTDAFGNAYGVGVQVGETSQSHLMLTPNAGNAFNTGQLQAATQFNTTNMNQMMPGMLGAVLFNAGAANQQMASILHSPIGMTGNGYALVETADSDDGTSKAGLSLGTVASDGMAMTYTPLVTFDSAGQVAAPAFTTYATSATPVVTTYGTSGAHSWTAPAGVTSVKVETWGGGGGGQGGSGAGGGGGEYAAEASVTVTPGAVYTATVGTGGAGGPSGAGGPGVTGGPSIFVAGAVTVRANGGQGSSSTSSAGGTGSTNSTHYNGGASGALSTGTSHGGSGGGSSAGVTQAGNTPIALFFPSAAGRGATAPTGGGNGGDGGNGLGTTGTAGVAGSAPGGGGGTGGAGTSSDSAGGKGAAGQVRITYTPSAAPLVASMSGIATTDSHGSAIPAGFMGRIVAPSPLSLVAIPETWQTPVYLPNWATAGTLNGNPTFQGLEYRLMAGDDVWIYGAATATGAGGTIFTLPVGYRPPTNHRGLLPCWIYSGSAVHAAWCQVTEAGDVNVAISLAGVTIASGDQVFINGRFPLGNVA